MAFATYAPKSCLLSKLYFTYAITLSHYQRVLWPFSNNYALLFDLYHPLLATIISYKSSLAAPPLLMKPVNRSILERLIQQTWHYNHNKTPLGLIFQLLAGSLACCCCQAHPNKCYSLLCWTALILITVRIVLHLPFAPVPPLIVRFERLSTPSQL